MTAARHLARDLATMGVRAGGTLLVHASLRRVGPAADAVLPELLTALGPDGTLVVPAFTAGNSDTSPEYRCAYPGNDRASTDRPSCGHAAVRPPAHPLARHGAAGRGRAAQSGGGPQHPSADIVRGGGRPCGGTDGPARRGLSSGRGFATGPPLRGGGTSPADRRRVRRVQRLPPRRIPDRRPAPAGVSLCGPARRAAALDLLQGRRSGRQRLRRPRRGVRGIRRHAAQARRPTRGGSGPPRAGPCP